MIPCPIIAEAADFSYKVPVPGPIGSILFSGI